MTTDPVWICHDCGYETRQEGEAIIHAERAHTHRLYLHDRWRGAPPTREMHASDWEGVYTKAVPVGESERLVREWRETALDAD
jgi:hypothetical protein